MSQTDSPEKTVRPAKAAKAAKATKAAATGPDETVVTPTPAAPRVPTQPVLEDAVEDTAPISGYPDEDGAGAAGYTPPAYLNIGPPIPAKSGKAGLVGGVLLIVVLVATTVLATVGYLAKSSALDKKSATVADQAAQINGHASADAAKDTQIATLTAQLKTATDQLSTLQNSTGDDPAKLATLSKAKTALSACVTADRTYIYDLVHKAGATTLKKAQTKANTACGAADKYLK